MMEQQSESMDTSELFPLKVLPPINPDVFKLVELGQLDSLANFTESDIRPFLGVLIRSGLILSGECSGRPAEFRQNILVPLSSVEASNVFVGLLSVDYNALESDVKKELQLRQKLGNREQDSILVQQLQNGLAYEYERGDSTRKLRLLLSELLFVMSQMHEPRAEGVYYLKASDIFDSWVFIEDICDTLSIALMELPNLLSLSDVCEALLHVNNGPYVICRIVANIPDSFLEVCTHLISNGEKCEEETEGGNIRLTALRMLCKMNPSQNLLIRSRCVEQCKMPGLAIFLSLETENILHDVIPFLTGLMLGNDIEKHARNWFSTYIRTLQSNPKVSAEDSLTHLRTAIWSYLRQLSGEFQNRDLDEISVVHASLLLKLACALKGIARFKFNDDEVNDLLKLITLGAPNSGAGNRFITLGLCCLLVCPSLVSSEHENEIVKWIKSLLVKKGCVDTNSCNSSFEEILLLMAIHFHGNQLNAVSDLVCATLGIKLPIRVNTTSRLKQIFIQQIFTERVVAEQAVKVGVTKNLNGNMSGFLPVHCIYQLIKSRSFTKHQVPIKDWIYSQLLSSSMPVHPILPALLETYASSVLIPPSLPLSSSSSSIHSKAPTPDLTNEPLSEGELLAVFNEFRGGGGGNLAPQLLLLYYILLYEDGRLAHARTMLAYGRRAESYSPRLFYRIPIKYLVQEAGRRQDESGGLFAPMLKLLTTHFPQLCIVNEWLEEGGGRRSSEVGPNSEIEDEILISGGEIERAFDNCASDPATALRLLAQFKKMRPYKLWEHVGEIVRSICKVIQPSVPRKVQDLYKEVWYELNNVFPRHLWEITSKALLPLGSVQLNVDELTIDPLQILRSDPQVFRSPPLMSILLHILAASLAASRYYLGKTLIENPNFVPGAPADLEREEVKVALTAVQDSAAVQILLEACLPTPQDKGIAGELCLKEVQSLICSFIHQMFIADPNLAKLVHFQGYPLELLPITVRGIPSMHICCDYIIELLNQPEIEKKVFAVQLISHLSIQYALPKAYSVAQHVLNYISQMPAPTSNERAEFYIPVISGLERLCVAFPPLVDNAVSILDNLGKVCTSQNSVERNRMCGVVRNKYLLKVVNETYDKIISHAMLDRRIF